MMIQVRCLQAANLISEDWEEDRTQTNWRTSGFDRIATFAKYGRPAAWILSSTWKGMLLHHRMIPRLAVMTMLERSGGLIGKVLSFCAPIEKARYRRDLDPPVVGVVMSKIHDSLNGTPRRMVQMTKSSEIACSFSGVDMWATIGVATGCGLRWPSHRGSATMNWSLGF